MTDLELTLENKIRSVFIRNTGRLLEGQNEDAINELVDLFNKHASLQRQATIAAVTGFIESKSQGKTIHGDLKYWSEEARFEYFVDCKFGPQRFQEELLAKLSPSPESKEEER